MNPCVVIKIGGKPASNQVTLDALLNNIADLMRTGFFPVLVHGGGADVSELTRKLGLEPQFHNGKRLTSIAEMDIVDLGLAGLVNTRILRRATFLGIRAVGLSGVDGGLFVAKPADGNPANRTGTITTIHPGILKDLSQAGYLPVVSSVSMDLADGQGLNINADDAAMALAIALKAEALVFLSDIPGILADGQVLSVVDRPLAERHIASGTISGGMIPKVQGALDAVAQGVGSVIIGGFEASGDLEAFLSRSRGTSIVHHQGDA